jgi:hypothetical protein
MIVIILVSWNSFVLWYLVHLLLIVFFFLEF